MRISSRILSDLVTGIVYRYELVTPVYVSYTVNQVTPAFMRATGLRINKNSCFILEALRDLVAFV